MENRQPDEHQPKRNIRTQRVMKAACAVAAACCLHVGIVSAAETAAKNETTTKTARFAIFRIPTSF